MKVDAILATGEWAGLPDEALAAGAALAIVNKGPTPYDARADLTVDASAAETLSVTTAGSWRHGTRLNLERALKIGDELGGHLVAGHVDGVADLIARDDLEDMARLVFRAPAPL